MARKKRKEKKKKEADAPNTAVHIHNPPTKN